MPIVTRSRSSSRTSSGSSSSGSSSSSSSSSSSGSGSDSSSSDTEASRASSQSRTSRVSRSSQKSAATPPVVVPPPPKVTQKRAGVNKAAVAANNAAASKKSAPSKDQTPTKITATTSNTTNKNRTSGTVTNAKTIPRSKGSGITKNVKRKAFIASSSESESAAPVSTPIIKKVGSKPPAANTIITNKKPPAVSKTPAKQQRKKPIPAVPANIKATVNKRSTAVKNDKSSNVKANAGGQRKLMKSIFSPDNSSEDSDFDTKPSSSKQNTTVNGATSSTSKSAGNKLSASTSNITTTTNKKKANAKNNNKKSTVSTTTTATTFDKQPVSTPQSKFASSTSLSASASSSASSSCSSSDSSSDAEEEDVNVEKKPPSVNNDNSDEKNDSSPAGSGTGARKRPVTRRQRRTIKSKTIPTTTTFNQSALTQLHSQSSGCWDSDFSDEPKSLARVPAKSSQPKSRLKPPEEEEEEKERKCPFPCCDSSGHLSGSFPTHSMLTTCPKYHGFSPEECKENADERHKRETERKKYYVQNQPHHKKPGKLTQEAKNWIAKTKELKARNTSDGLCSEYDLSLWNDALALAAGRIETEQGESLSYRSVAMGRWEMSCWCASPYPEPLCHCRRLFICEFCLKPVQSGTVLRRHCAKCVWRHPPGDEIYRKERLSVWEVDGKTQKTYCQNLCLLAKCFLDHKTLYLDVDPFLFYVMTLADSTGCHIVGYFSKEKNQSFLNYNVSCILTLPPYQRQGFGRLLIDFSYLLTRVEGKVGSPEKPLSDLGLISYRSYWKDAVLRRMCACASREMNVKDLSIELGVTSADLISTLQFLGMLKYWKGKHLVLKKQDVLEEYLERVRRREQRTIDSSCLRWRPWNNPTP